MNDLNLNKGAKTMQYSYLARNTGQDNIYKTRLRLMAKRYKTFKISGNQKRYSYFMQAYLGIVLQ